MDRKRLKGNHMDDHDCHSHQCEHCKKLIFILWKANGKLISRPTEGPGAFHAVCTQRHLEKCCNELGHSSIAKRANEKIKMKKNMKEK